MVEQIKFFLQPHFGQAGFLERSVMFAAAVAIEDGGSPGAPRGRGCGVQMAMASTTLSRRRTLRTPEIPVELICALR
jgi:hypothetical protein